MLQLRELGDFPDAIDAEPQLLLGSRGSAGSHSGRIQRPELNSCLWLSPWSC